MSNNRLIIALAFLVGFCGVVSACPSRTNRHVDPLPDGAADLAYTTICVSFLEIYGGEVETPSTIDLYRSLWSVCVERNEAGEPRFGPSHLLFSVHTLGDPVVQLRVEHGPGTMVEHSEADDLELSEIMAVNCTETFRDRFCRAYPGVLKIELYGTIAGETLWDGFAPIDLSHVQPCGE